MTESLRDQILKAAGAESASRRVVEFPARSKFLDNTAPGLRPAPELERPPVPAAPEIPPGAIEVPAWAAWGIRGAKYLGFACVFLGLAWAFSWTRQTLILADVGRSTCSTLRIADKPEAQAFWTEEDAASTVPQLKTRQFVACMKAGNPF
jgi:hypothetical protein